MDKQTLKRALSSFLAVVFVTSSFVAKSTMSFNAADANGSTGYNYVINCDTQQFVTTTKGELPNFEEVRPGKIRHGAFDNGSHSGGSTALSYEYTVKNAYRTTGGKVLYPGEQIICIDHWTRYSRKEEKEGSMAVIQSYGLSFMAGNFSAKWQDFDKKIPREPRIDLLTVNTDFGAHSNPNNYQGSNGDTGTFLPEDDPKDNPNFREDFKTDLIFTSKSESGKEVELSYFGNANSNIGPTEVPIEYLVFPLESMTAANISSDKLLTSIKSDQSAYASGQVGPVPTNWYIIIPTVQNAGLLYGIPPSYISQMQILTWDLNFIDVKNDSLLGIKSFKVSDLKPLGLEWAKTSDISREGVSYFIMSSAGALEGTDYPTLAKNSRILVFKDMPDQLGSYHLFGKDTWKYKEDSLYAQKSDLERNLNSRRPNDTAATLRANSALRRLTNSFYAAITPGDFKNLPNITLNRGEYTGFPFATGYKGSSTEKYSNYYNPFYSLLSITTYNFYSHNNLFSHVLPDGTKVPRYFSGSGIGSKTAVADRGLQGSSKLQPFWGWSSFKQAHGQNYGFCGDVEYPSGKMPNGRTATENADRMLLLAEYINNKMTRSITPDAMKRISSLSPTVNNKDTFEAAITWNTSITKKFNDPQDLYKMYSFQPNGASDTVTYNNASFLVTDENGKSTKTAESDYIVVGPFYAHTDYPESRLQIGFTKNIDISGLAKPGDEVLTSKLPSGETVADYVILTSEAIVNNRGEGGSDRRKTDLYANGANNTEFKNPFSADSTLMQSYEVVNGNVPLTNADLGKYDVASPHEVVKHEPTYWDGTTTPKDIYDPKYNTAAKDSKFLINNWGKGEFYIAVRRTTNNIFVNDLPQVTIGYQTQTGTLTQTNVDLTNTSHSRDYQGFLITDSEVAKSSAVVDLNLKLANFKINKAESNGTPLEAKSFYLYRLADKNPALPETDPNRYEWVRYVPVYADMVGNNDPAKELYYPHQTDQFGNVSFNGLIPGWYMIFEDVHYSYRKVAYLQTYDKKEPERQGVPITIDNAGLTNESGQPYNTSITLPVGARGQNVPIDDPLNKNTERAGDVFYVDNGVVKGLDMANTKTMVYNVYSNIVNDPIIFYKEIGDINNLVDKNGRPLNITRSQYSDNVQFVFQAQENQNEFYVAPVRDGRVNMFQATIHKGSFPAADVWIDQRTGELVDDYWWINSHNVRIEEHINPALGIHPDQVKDITKYINTGRYDNDLMKYANTTETGEEFFHNYISEQSLAVELEIIKEDSDTHTPLEGAAFTLYNPRFKVYATSDNQSYDGTPNAYLTGADGKLKFKIDNTDHEKLKQMLSSEWELKEVKAPEGYSLLKDTLTIRFSGVNKTVEEGTIDGGVIKYKKIIGNKPHEEVFGSLIVTKAWYQYVGGQKVQWQDGGEATFRLFRGTVGDRTKLWQEFTLSQSNSTYRETDMPLGDYWIEEVNTPEGVSVSYSASQGVTLTDKNPNGTINVENVKDSENTYVIAIAKKQSKQATMRGTTDFAFSNLPYYDGPAQFVITYTGPKGQYEKTVTYDRSKVGIDGYLEISVPYAGPYTIREINMPDAYEPEIKVAGTGVEWSPIGADTPFGFEVPDHPGPSVALHMQIANNKPASIAVIKTDSDTGERIWDKDMELTMYADGGGKPSGRRLGLPKTMGDDGRFIFKTTDGYDFKVGETVWLVESNPPKDPNGNQYQAIQMPVYVSEEIAYNNQAVEMKNEMKKSKFVISKVGTNDEPIEGALFEVYADERLTLLLGSGKTDNKGMLEFALRGNGPFYVKEISVPVPYIIDSEVKIVTPKDDNTVLKVVNKKQFRIVAKKTDSMSGSPISGAEFQLLDKAKQPYKINGKEVTGVSDGVGNIIWNITDSQYLTVDTDDTFYLRETKTPSGYFEPENDFKLEIKETTITDAGLYEGCYVFTLKNDAQFGLRIKKTEVLDNRPSTPAEAKGISGITFEIYNSSDDLVATEETDVNGVIELKGLHYGDYYAKEVPKVGSIYLPIQEKIKLTVKQLNSEGNFFEDSWSTYNWIQNERKTGSLEIYKVDNEGNYLAGVSFGLYQFIGEGIPSEFKEGQCKLLKVAQTSAEGKLVFDNLELGKYWLVEISELPTYIPAKPILFEIAPDDTTHDFGDVLGQNLKAKVVNTRVPASIRVIKSDAETGKPIEGITFELSDGANIVRGITNKNGIITFENLKRGVKYTLKEVAVTGDYILNDKPVEITISQLDTTIDVNMTNSKFKGMIEILKESSETKAAIAGAEFQLFADNQPQGTPKKTDKDGRVTWNDLVIGPSYSIQEVSVPQPFILDTTRIPVAFEKSRDNDVFVFKKTVSNDVERFYVRLWKIDGETQKSLEGAEFDLYASDKQTKLNRSPIVVGANGMTSQIEVPAKGTYYFKETKAPEGYILDDRFIETVAYSSVGSPQITLAENNKVKEKSYFIELTKVDGDTSATLSGAEFTLYNANHEKIEAKVTGSAGSVRFVVKNEGTYYVKETKAPDGYKLLDKEFVFNVNETQAVYKEEVKNFIEKAFAITVYKKDKENSAPLGDARFEVYDSNYTKLGTMTTTLPNGSASFNVPKEGTYYLKEITAPKGYDLISGYIEVTVGGAVNVVEKTIFNEKTKEYSIGLYKKDKENNAPLANAVFELFDSNKSKIDEVITTLPTGSASIKVPGPGTYYLREKQAPAGYKLVEGFIPVEVNQTANVVEKTIYNERTEDYWITVYKQDSVNKAPKADATFSVYGEDKTTLIGTITTQLPNGSASIKVPNKGTYYLKEVKAPAGYKLIEGFIPVVVGGASNVVEKTIYNEQNKYFITVYKKDSVNNAPLGDAEFEVYDESNKYIGKVMTTLPTGAATFEVPNAGTYFLKEVKAPEGYTLKPGLIPVSVGGTVNVVERTIYNEKTPKYILRVYKKDAENKAPLSNAVIGVYDDQYKQIGTIVTTIPDGSGFIEVPKAGTYYLKELQAPRGYKLVDGFIPVSVNSNTNIVESCIYDVKDETPKNSVKIIKEDNHGEVLRGVKFGLYDEKQRLMDTGYTDRDGILIFDRLNDGIYYVMEEKALPGYILDKKEHKVSLEGGNTEVVKVVNAKEEGEGWLSIRKYIDGTTTPLSGVVFRITSDAGYDRTFTTDNAGNIYIAVPEGTYRIQEVQGVSGYQMDSSVKTITVERGKIAQDIVFYNAPINATLAITKVDADTASPLSGAKFGVFGSGDTLVSTLITDSNGRASTVLPYGDYILRELEAPSGYVLDIKSSVTFTIDSSRSFVEMTITNNKIPVVVTPPKTGFGENNFMVVISMLLLSIISGIALIVLNRASIQRFVKKCKYI